MNWTFEREGAKLSCEIGRDESNGRYRLAITRPDGTTSVEEIDQPTALIERSLAVMMELRNEGWRGNPT